jgi:hypothetical protein
MITRLVRAGSILAIIMAFAGSAFGYDILLNSDFSEGTAHWKDDPNATACLNAQATSSGAMIPLSSNWSRISQVFDTPDAVLALSLTYSFSDDGSFTPGAVFNNSVVQQLTGVSVVPFSLPLKSNEFVAMIVDPQAHSIHYIKISSNAPNAKSIIATFHQLLEHEEKTFYLVFPPGAGSVTVSRASLDEPSSDGDQ